MKNARENKREHNDNDYRNPNRKKKKIIKMLNKQHLNYYNSMIFSKLRKYIASIFRIDFQTNFKRIR